MPRHDPSLDPSEPAASALGVSGTQTTQAYTPPGTKEDSAHPKRTEAVPRELPRVPGYDVLELLGRGGMGVVYKARQQVLDRVVALKMLRPDLAHRKDALKRFAREARVLAQLSNPHIVTIYAIEDETDPPYFAMEFVGGGTLHEHRECFRGTHEAATLVAKIGRAVHYAHEKGILHRDLKPHNILLDEHGEPKVNDFGLAKLLEEATDLTQSGDTLGTPAYMAPEQAAGQTQRVGPASDTWALGAILYELVTGQRPFSGQNREETLQNILHRDPVLPSRRHHQMDRRLEAVILKCLEKEPDCRYASALGLAEDLERFLSGQPVLARPPSPLRGAIRLLTRPRNLALAAGIALIALLLFLVFKEPTQTPPPPDNLRARTDPEEVLALRNDRLREGKSVTLVGASGLPEWYRWRTEGQRGPLEPTKRPLNLESLGLCLLELMPRAPVSKFELRAEVHMQSNISGEMGIYVGHNPRDTAKGLEHWCVSLTISEQRAHDARPSSPKLHALRYREKDAKTGLVNMPFQVLKGPDLAPPPAWRQLTLKVTPEKLDVFVEKKLIGTVTCKELSDVFSAPLMIPDRGKEPAPAFDPHGGLGIFIRQADASFRNVVVEPVP